MPDSAPRPPDSRLPRLVLASGSPRRRELLGSLDLAFRVRPVDLDESLRPGEEPEAYVRRLAREKARERGEAGELVLAADTVVVLGGRVLGKPRDEEEAVSMLGSLAGREHTVLTGVCLLRPESGAEGGAAEAHTVESSRVWIAPLSLERRRWYAGTGEPMDKAGSYAIQGLGAVFVERVEGNYTNVVGLPLPAVARLFEELGHDLLAFRR